MSIRLVRTDEGYQVTVTPLPRLPTVWQNERPMSEQAAIDRLVELGYHMQDIADALQIADQDWDGRGT